MDGGWFFPVDVPIKFALEASDPGEPVNRLAEWAETNAIQRCTRSVFAAHVPSYFIP